MGLAKRSLAVTVPLVLCVGIVALVIRPSTADEDHAPPESAVEVERLSDADMACAPIMRVLSEPVTGDEFEKAGLRSARVPAAVLEEWSIGSLTCLGSGTADRVRAVVVELVDADHESTALWLLPHEEEGAMDEWRGYLKDIALQDWAPVDVQIERVGPGLVALRHAGDKAHWRSSDTGSERSMWQAVQSATQDGRR